MLKRYRVNKKLHKFTHESIKPYGYIIDAKCVKDDGRGNRFGILLKEKSSGWRIGYLIVRDRTIARLEYHDTLETFEPVSGRCVIALAAHAAPRKPKVFLLDRPIVLKKGVWHDVAAITKKAEIKIVENIDVDGEYYYMKDPIRAGRYVR